jgi:hypothetical protein
VWINHFNSHSMACTVTQWHTIHLPARANSHYKRRTAEFLMKYRSKGEGFPKTDVTEIACVIKAAKQSEHGMHLRPGPISIIYGNGFFLHLMAIGGSIKNQPPLLLPLSPQIIHCCRILCILF